MRSGKLTEAVTILRRIVEKNGFGEEVERYEEGSKIFMSVNSLSGTYRQVDGVGVQDYDAVFGGRYYLYSMSVIADGTILRWNGHDYRVESVGITSDSRVRDLVSFKCNRINN